ncbi:tetratricopeptide repeat-containing diguanylate cyclase [Fervidobacterium sp.]
MLPVTVERADKSISVFFRYSGEKHIVTSSGELVSLSYEERKRLVESILRIAKFVLLGNIPPFPAINLFDIFMYAGEFFFRPPVIFSSEFYKHLMDSSKMIKSSEGFSCVFVDEEYLTNGTYDKNSTMRILAEIIELFDEDGEKASIVPKLKSCSVTVADLEKDTLSDGTLYRIISEITSAEKNYTVAQIDTNGYYRLFKDYIARIDYHFTEKNEAIFYIGDGFTNVVRQLLLKKRNELSQEEFSGLVKCLYSVCKFDTVVGELINIFKRFGRIILVVKDVDEPHYLVRRFLEILRNSEIKTVVLTYKSKQPDKTFSIEIPEKKLSDKDFEVKLSRMAKDLFLVRVLGKEFDRQDLMIFSSITGKDGESMLRNLLKEQIVRSDDGEYIVDYDFTFQMEDDAQLKLIHEMMAKEYSKRIGSYNQYALKAAFHYMRAGRELSAVVTYLRFVKVGLEKYTFSPSFLSDALRKAYEILKKNRKDDSYAFHKLRTELQNRAGVGFEFKDGRLPEKRIFTYLKALELFVEEKYLDCVFYIDNTLTSFELPKYKSLKLSLLKERAYQSYYDKLSDTGPDIEEIQKIKIWNEKWAELKAEWLWLIGNALVYTNRKKATVYLNQALEIANQYNLKHLLVSIYNSFGMVYDGYLLSIMYFKEAIRIAGEIGYTRRSVTPRLNLARELLYFGKFKELFTEFSLLENSLKDYLSYSDLSFLYRLHGMVYSYLHRYEEGLKYFKKAFEIESEKNLPHHSLRGLILHEMLCGNRENAKELIQKYHDNPAIHTRAFEYFIAMIRAKDDKEFFRAWNDYITSDYTLLREEILYLFTEQIFKVDKERLANELDRWDSFYTSEMTKLSLLYILLAKQKYYELIQNKIKRDLVKLRISRILFDLGIEKDFNQSLKDSLFIDFRRDAVENEIIDTLEILKSIDQKIGLDEFLRIFSNILINLFEPQHFFVSVTDRKTNLNSSIGIAPFDEKKSTVRFDPLEVYIKDNIDKDSEYLIFFSSNYFVLSEEDKKYIWDKIILLDELFASQVRGIIYRERATRDVLTGTYNRWRFLEILQEYIKEPAVSKNEKEISVFIADIDNFKKINDTYGHLTGDRVLKNIAAILKDNIGENGIVARYGGEEFVGAMKVDKASCVEICESIRKVIEKISYDIFGFQVTISFGVASSSEKHNITELIGLADKRLYIAKETGKNRVCFS